MYYAGESMLINVNTIKKITKIPYEVEYRNFMKRIDCDDFQKIVDRINDIIDNDIDIGKEVQTAGWIPGNNLEGTVLNLFQRLVVVTLKYLQKYLN